VKGSNLSYTSIALEIFQFLQRKEEVQCNEMSALVDNFHENTAKQSHCKETLTIFVIMRRGGGRFSTSMASCCDGELGSLFGGIPHRRHACRETRSVLFWWIQIAKHVLAVRFYLTIGHFEILKNRKNIIRVSGY
jgi:hypothetical protein